MSFDLISVRELEHYIGKMNCLILDLRKREEYQNGHVPDSINIPYEEFKNRMYTIPMEYEIILYCEHGNKSMNAARSLSKMGYRAQSVVGGMKIYTGPLSYSS